MCWLVVLPQVSGKELGSRKKARDEALPASSAASGSPSPQQKSGRGQKFSARKSREAAAKAAKQAAGSGATQAEAQGQPAATSTSQLETVKVPDSPPSK
jgi:hypothetical protein